MIHLKRRSKRNLLIGFGFSLFILILSSAMSYISINQLLDSQRAVDHTAEVEGALNSLISRMKDAETGQRGFLLSGDETFLDPYNGARADIIEYFNHVQLLTVEDSQQQQDFPVLERYIEDKFRLIDKSIKEKKRGIPPTVPALLVGKVAMDSIRVVVNRMITRENQMMISKNARMDRFAAITPVMIGIAALLSMGITILFYFRVSKDAQIAVDLQNQLKLKEEKTIKQIEIIDGIAKKIAGGDYHARLDKADLE
ncbi:MAG: hypothetical protein EOP48_21340 [Sphingobacteriales bacterium]|nr:MAG: hypothetical protein EOP48_21340 [Sphingobacteriales bacterium]